MTIVHNLIIVSRRPGMYRGGVAHPPVKAHALDAFTAAQLREIAADPDLTVVMGQVVDAADVEELLRKSEPKVPLAAADAELDDKEDAPKAKKSAKP